VNGVLVASLGNPLVGDDGVGLAVLRKLEQQELPAGVRLADLGTDLLALSSHLDGIGKVILLDAVNFNGEPGELRRFDYRELQDTDGVELKTAHGINPLDALALLAAAGILGEREVILLGCQPEVLDPGAAMSPAVEEAVEKLLLLVVSECEAP